MNCPSCNRALLRVDTNHEANDVGGRWKCPECKVIRTGITLTMPTAEERSNPEPVFGRIIVKCTRCGAVGFGCSNGHCDHCCMNYHGNYGRVACYFQEAT